MHDIVYQMCSKRERSYKTRYSYVSNGIIGPNPPVFAHYSVLLAVGGRGDGGCGVFLTLTRLIKSAATGQAPDILELRNTPGKKHKPN